MRTFVSLIADIVSTADFFDRGFDKFLLQNATYDQEQ